MVRPAFPWVLAVLVLFGCGNPADGPCADDGDPLGPPCLLRIESHQGFEILSAPLGAFPAPARYTKHMLPVHDQPDLLSIVFQNLNRYPEHQLFLQVVFPDRFAGLDPDAYQALILLRASRRYFAGNLFRFDDPAGSFYGFTLWTATRTEELLEPEEVLSIYQDLSGVFSAGELRYTFDPTDTMAREKARTWTDPGFPIYFPD